MLDIERAADFEHFEEQLTGRRAMAETKINLSKIQIYGADVSMHVQAAKLISKLVELTPGSSKGTISAGLSGFHPLKLAAESGRRRIRKEGARIIQPYFACPKVT
jgi:hypothetical protein